MKRLRILQTACALASLLMLAACTQNELTDGTRLAEGKYPLTLAAKMGGLATTRATADGTWNNGDEVAVQVGSGNNAPVKKYTAATNGDLTSTDPFYWQKADETKQVSAWYLGTGYSGTQPTTWSVHSDQSTTESGNSSDNYQRSDFLYAPQTDISYGSDTKSLTFYHQVAKVVINICKTDFLTDKSQITAVSINNVALSGKFSVPTSGNYGLEVDETASKTTPVIPKELASANADVNFLVSYEALVIPQTVAKDGNFIGITLNDGITYYYKAVENHNKLNAGSVHTYNIAVKRTGLEVSVGENNMGWGSGATGSGSTELITKIDLSQGPYAISDNDKYILTGSGSYTLTINGSPTVIFKNARIETPKGKGAPIEITGGSPTLVFNGTNTLICNEKDKGVITLSGGASTCVTLDGDGNGELILKGHFNEGEEKAAGDTIRKDALLGSGYKGVCGNILIRNLTLSFKGQIIYATGIGAGSNSTCGDIIIENSTITMTEGDEKGISMKGGAGIGTSVPWKEDKELTATACGDIRIIKSAIKFKYGNFYDYFGAAIGCSSRFQDRMGSPAPDITVKGIYITLTEGQDKEQFLNNLVPGNEDSKADKVGQGSYQQSSWSYVIVGKITKGIHWYASDGTEIQ